MSETVNDLVILRLSDARQALKEATTLQETKLILDRAQAAEVYARRQHLGTQAIGYARAIKYMALRQLGSMLMAMPKNRGTLRRGSRSEPRDLNPILADLGITKKVSMYAQQLCKLTSEVFDKIVAGTISLAEALRNERMRASTTNQPAWSLDTARERLRAKMIGWFNGEIEAAPPGSNHGIANLMGPLTGEIASEIEAADDPELREAVGIARADLSIRDASPGAFKIFDGSTVVASSKSTHARWFKDLTIQADGVTPLKRREVELRLDDIEQGKLQTKRTERTHFAVLWAIRSLGRGGQR